MNMVLNAPNRRPAFSNRLRQRQRRQFNQTRSEIVTFGVPIAVVIFLFWFDDPFGIFR